MARAAQIILLLAIFIGQSASVAAAVKEIVIPWSDTIDAAAVKDAIERLQINGDDGVSLRVLHFNFLHYTLKVTVEERTIESYATLDRLWSQVFKATALPLMAAQPGRAEAPIMAWRRALAEADAELSNYLSKFAGHVSLTQDQCEDIGQQARTLGTDAIARLETRRRDALDDARTSEDFDLYERILTQHRAVADRLTDFRTAANLVEHGWVEPLGRKKAGTVVTFMITPAAAQGASAGQPFEESYFVRSTRPLLLHVGYSASRLKDLRFDRVRTASGSDLFLATKSSDATQSLVTFLSYEIRQWGPRGRIGVQGTLGTSFQKPGENILVGAGLRVTRFVLTVGASGSGVQEGKGSVLESVAGAAGVRELFTTIATRQQWAPFFSISLRVY